jgi:uncharacterized membrane protein YjfL (UPF0719 family)
MEGIDYIEVARRGSFVLEGLVILFVGKLFRDLLSLARGYKTSELLTVHDNPAAAIDLCGYLVGLMLGVLGSLVVSSETWLGQASDIALTGLVVIACLLLASWVADKAIFRGIDDHAALAEDGNVALALGRAGVFIGTGLVVRGALGPDSAIVDCVAWVGIGLLAMVVMSLVYQRVTPYDDLAQIRDNNVAAALPLAGVVLAVGIIVEAAIAGQVESWSEDLASVGIYLGVSLVLLLVLRVLADLFLLPGASLSKEVAEDRNTGAGLVEGTSFVCGAMLLAFFLT